VHKNSIFYKTGTFLGEKIEIYLADSASMYIIRVVGIILTSEHHFT